MSELPELKVKFSLVPETLEEPFSKLFLSDGGFFKSEPGGFFMNKNYALNGAEKIYQLKPRADDVWLVTFPKCGTNWTAELLWLLMNNCDFDKAGQLPLLWRATFPDMAYLSPAGSTAAQKEGLKTMTPEVIDQLPSPRLIRPHMPFYLLHPELLDTCKVVYVARNPKDVIVSYYHHHKLFPMMHGFTGDLEQFAQYFIEDKVLYAPFFPHVVEAWNLRHHPNLHFMFYEDMKKDLKGEIEKVAKFLGTELTEDQLEKLRDHLRFENLSKNEAVNGEYGRKIPGMMDPNEKLFRKGKTGDWKNRFSPELNEKIDQWIEKNLTGTDLKFVTELEHQD